MKRDDLIKLLLDQVPQDADVRVENCMIHDGRLAVVEKHVPAKGRYPAETYHLLYGLVG